MALLSRIIGVGSRRRFERWEGELRRMEGVLRDFSGRTEGEFLSVGERLQDFHARSAEIARMARELAETASGDDIRQATAGLSVLLDRMAGYLARADGETERVVGALRSIGRLLVKVDEPLAGFRKVIRVLRILGVSTRIESARMSRENTGFDTVSDHVEKLSSLIEEKTGRIAGQRDALGALIGRTLATVLDIKEQQRARAAQILAETRASLGFLGGTHQKCAAASRAVSARSDDIARNIGEIVTSMQSHDITRQQIEHVAEAIGEVLGRMRDAREVRRWLPDERELSLLGETGEVCGIQSAQLDNARQTLVGAVGRITDNLRGVARNAAQMADGTREMVGVVDQAGRSFLGGMEKDLSGVAATLVESAQGIRELSTIMQSLLETVSDMASFVGDIEHFGSEIELIALNAGIKATHTGGNGAALRVLAESIQRLSADARVHTNAVSLSLRGIREAAEGLRKGMGASGEERAGEGEVEAIRRDMAELLRLLHAASERVGTRMRSVDSAARSLSSDIEEAIRRLSVPDLASDVLGSVTGRLEEIRGQSRAVVPAARSLAAEDAPSLQRRYTMQEERDVHAAVTGKRLPSPAPPPARLPAPAARGAEGERGAAGEDLGDNVELF